MVRSDGPTPILTVQPRLAEQVYEAILSEIIEGRLAPNARLIQDELAEAYGVSRQPVQQALLLLRNHGLVKDAPRRGLIVSAPDAEYVRNLYEIRAALEGLACRMAAERDPARAAAEGAALIEAGRAAVAGGSRTQQIAADMAFHCFLYDLSGNPLIAETTAPHWHYLRRIMGEVLRGDETTPSALWDEHAAILDAVTAGDADEADRLARSHITRAAKVFVTRLQAQEEAAQADLRRRSLRR
ncbi:GntR family transcriptional regulator [Methylobacterium oryzihabitans]|uniref:GntR family transcriptional regulator n=1 Tax=Methylobacterium oryzihabitans TaxID=2499852 RepID=A0A3S2VL92_9HYPH|nr:GntR family transcriptional regulator [Methylobacterium oryzihabitans]RVU15434.1 GntR family transcriptional regulator [Methylobacterium oryzihabitans]